MDRQETAFDVPDMKCSGCSERVARVLRRREDVRSATVDLEEKRAVVVYDADRTDPEALQAAIKKAGYTPQPA